MTEVIHVGSLELKFLQSKHDTNGALDVFEMTCPPEGQMPIAHYHRDWDETVIGLAGVTTFTVEGKPHDLAPGASLFIPRGTVHGFDNRSGKTAVSMGILTPGVLGPEYFREIGAAIASGHTKESDLAAIMQKHGLIPVAV